MVVLRRAHWEQAVVSVREAPLDWGATLGPPLAPMAKLAKLAKLGSQPTVVLASRSRAARTQSPIRLLVRSGAVMAELAVTAFY
jgi:hypothetical protein